ncbi:MULTISPECIES: ion channel [Neptunomonas]|uniref:Two pore domain potassium channel family protein n=1 Tax=Neptunomonas marina TaxID=1815562 RepID=A0A437Q4E7_9GAMM|nr:MULTISPECIES: ion channel [Neptunomonas]RVU29388.1 two pore domain potassium channel family protein [Neptunomonas marina]
MLFLRIRRMILALYTRASIAFLLLFTLFYVVSSYLMMAVAGEQALLAPNTFFYWLVTTASTVGYGDLSPGSDLGRFFAYIWVIPAGINIFALLVTRLGFAVWERLLRGKKGLRMLNVSDHILIIGWNDQRTLRFIDMLRAKGASDDRAIVLCVKAEVENPLPGRIEFVRVESFIDPEQMKRACVAAANTIVIDTDADDVTVTTALFCKSVSPDSHKVAYLQDESAAGILRVHCPNIEIVPSVSVEMLAKTAVDPGSSALHKQLLDTTEGQTQYRVEYRGEPRTMKALFHHFKDDLNATIIGVMSADDKEIQLNPPVDRELQRGDFLYYIAASRLSEQACFDF